MNFNEIDTHAQRLEYMSNLIIPFSERARKIDEEGSFPHENIQDLIKTGYTSLTVPEKYGGQEISLFEFVTLQEKIGEGDGSTALSIGWHLGIIKNLAEKKIWADKIFDKICNEVFKGALINGAASEPVTGSPTRGGKPTTTAERRGDKWVLNGRKTFTTMAPVLDYFIVSASVKDRDEVGNFLIPRAVAGLSIEETWDSIAMRGTGSHDLVLQNVELDSDMYVEQLAGNKKANGWLLHIPACYLGIAQAAQNEAIKFAKTYAPNSIKGTILNLPNVQQKIGEMELELMKARHFLYSVAKKWDESNDEERDQLLPELGAVKLVVTNSAILVVDLAMRVVGARSLSLKSPLQRYYRDVRAGLHNPPMDDMTIQMLARNAVK